MVALKELTSFLDELLRVKNFPADPSNNGLQCEGKAEVKKAVFGVDAGAALFEAAAAAGADFVLVHHGLSWGHGFQRLTGIDAARFKLLLTNGISLYAVHLPLDAHPEHGHNAILAQMLDLRKAKMFFDYHGYDIGVSGELKKALPVETVAEILSDRLEADYTVWGANGVKVRRIGIVSGGGGSDTVVAAREQGLDCVVTGEVTHADYQVIRECGVPVISLGHYKSETPGVRRMMELIQAKFKIECEFIDLPTGL